VILVDSSAWVEFLRGSGTRPAKRVSDLISGGLATTDAVVMEILAGARDRGEWRRLGGLLTRCEPLVTRAPGDYVKAAELFAECRRQGLTPRSLLGCLIAAVAIRADVAVLHHDTDFDRIARVSALRIA
jgi:predicted nucleic acid-binding protein